MEKEKKIKNYTTQIIDHLRGNLGEKNLGILLSVLADACDYTMGEKGIREIRQVEVKFNNYYTTKVDLTYGFNESH